MSLNRVPDTRPGFGLFYVPVLHPDVAASEHEHLQGIKRQVMYADAHGWRNVWLAEHHGTTYGGMLNAPEVLGAWLAAQTSDIRIGPGIAVLPLHDPRHLAERYALFDQLSNGRLDMGIGHGFLSGEFELFGISLQDNRARFLEAHKVLLQAWQQETFSHSGNYFHYEDAASYPRCYRRMPPVWMAASNTRQSFELAGRHGHHLMVNPYTRTEDEIREGLSYYFAALDEAGAPRDQVRITAMLHLYCGRIDHVVEEALNVYIHSMAEAAAQSSKRNGAVESQKHFSSIRFSSVYPDKVLFGTPAELQQQIDRWRGIGITDFCLMSQFGNLSWEHSMESVQLFTEEVMTGVSLSFQNTQSL